MANNKKTVSFLSLISIAIIATAASINPANKFKNLKVLPQDISEKQLDSIMNAYTKALKVSCEFCHIPAKDMFSINQVNNKIDFALDNSMKENARKMIRLTIDINKNYFYFDSLARPEYLNVVHCNTCHRGSPFPVHD
ncbi:hypothetical protein BH11BAC4_BH11BAC4_13640 [soil metagenome]